MTEDLDPPIWTLFVITPDGQQMYERLSYAGLLSLFIVPLGPALNRDRPVTMEIFEAGVLRAKMEVYKR